MKNTQRHDACSTSQPPSTGPTAAVIALNAGPGADRPPRASRRTKAALMSARLRAPAARRRRPARRAPRSAASDARRQAARRRGEREERDPDQRRRAAGRSDRPASRRPAAARRGTARRPRRPTAPAATVAPRRVCSAGSATLTTVPSMKAMLEPRIVAASTHGPALGAQRPSAAPAAMTPSSHGALSRATGYTKVSST